MPPPAVDTVTPASGVGTIRTLDLRPAEAFAAGRVPGAVRLDPGRFNRADPPAGGLLPGPEEMRAILAEAHLADGAPVVVRDAGGQTAAGRAVWALRAWGIETASWLDGGWPAWVEAGGEVERGDAPGRPLATGEAPARLADAPSELVTADELAAELGDPRLRVLDVRGAAEYAGTDVRAARGGRVPGAIHHEWTRQLDAAGRALPAMRLREALAALDVTPEHRVVVYCQTHQRSAVTWVLMRHAGFVDVRGLDGAWSVWGNRADLPIERG